MATDRDEQLRQQQELEEIRRSFAEMGARMGSMFEPSEPGELEGTRQQALPAPPAAAPPPLGIPTRPRWWWMGLVLLFVAGTAVGWVLPRGGDGAEAPPPTQTTPATTQETEPAESPQTVISVPEVCVDMAQLADEVISRLNRNDRDNRLVLDLRDYTIANQACRREALP
jgi:hypothetical protein